MNYDELVKALRDDNACLSIKTAHEAADAIEELREKLFSAETDLGDIAETIEFWQSTSPRWIPVTERLPENGAEVLAWSSSGFAYVDWWIDGAWKVNGLVDGKYEFVTHWMPLPEPPKETI